MSDVERAVRYLYKSAHGGQALPQLILLVIQISHASASGFQGLPYLGPKHLHLFLGNHKVLILEHLHLGFVLALSELMQHLVDLFVDRGDLGADFMVSVTGCGVRAGG